MVAAAELPFYGDRLRASASALRYADNGATRHRLLVHGSPVQLRGEFERFGYRFAPPIGSLRPRRPSITPRHRFIRPRTPEALRCARLTCLAEAQIQRSAHVAIDLQEDQILSVPETPASNGGVRRLARPDQRQYIPQTTQKSKALVSKSTPISERRAKATSSDGAP